VRRTLLPTAIVLVALSGRGLAEGAPDARAPSELPAALETLHELENRLGTLEREVASLSGARAADPDVRRAIEALHAEMRELDRRLGEMQVRAAEERAVRATGAVGYDEGLFLRLPELRLILNGDVQGRYTGTIRPAGVTNGSDFDLHHARMGVGATVAEVVDLKILLEFGGDFASGVRLNPVRDFYADLRPVRFLTLRVGQFKVPFSREALSDDLLLTFVDRSLATRAFALPRDLGGLVEARLLDSRLIVQAAITDGIDATLEGHNDNLDLAYWVRLSAQPLGPMALREGDPQRSRPFRFAVGGAFAYDLRPSDRPAPLNDLDHNGVVDNVEVISAGAELAARFSGLALEGEYYFRHERPGGGLPTQAYHGGYAQVSAMLLWGLQLAARYAYAEPHTLGGPPPLGILGGTFRSGHEVSAVVSWFQWRDHVKAQLEYDFRDETAADPTDQRQHRGHILAAQVQAGF
jgi:hypothetical protein